MQAGGGTHGARQEAGLAASPFIFIRPLQDSPGDKGTTTMDTQTPVFEPLISAAEAGQLLGVHPVTLLRWAREGKVPSRRLGRRVTFRASELNSWYIRSTLVVPFVSPNPKGEGT